MREQGREITARLWISSGLLRVVALAGKALLVAVLAAAAWVLVFWVGAGLLWLWLWATGPMVSL